MEIQERKGRTRKKKVPEAKKKVRFARAKRTKRKTEKDKSEEGGAIIKSVSAPVTIDKKKASFTKALYGMREDEEPDYFQDVESSMYSHYGGQISGRGAKFDPPHVRKFVHHTLKQHPKLLDAYNKGKVVNPPIMKVPYRRGGRGPDIINYGGSLHPISHSENGKLVTFDEGHTGTSHFHVRYR